MRAIAAKLDDTFSAASPIEEEDIDLSLRAIDSS